MSCGLLSVSGERFRAKFETFGAHEVSCNLYVLSRHSIKKNTSLLGTRFPAPLKTFAYSI